MEFICQCVKVKSFDFCEQLVFTLALFGTKHIGFAGVTQGNHQPDRMGKSAECTQFFVIEPAQNAGAKALRGCFRRQVSGSDADIDGAVIIVFNFGPQCGGSDIGLLRNDREVPVAGVDVKGFYPTTGEWKYMRTLFIQSDDFFGCVMMNAGSEEDLQAMTDLFVKTEAE